jgi:hypothetical protein
MVPHLRLRACRPHLAGVSPQPGREARPRPDSAGISPDGPHASSAAAWEIAGSPSAPVLCAGTERRRGRGLPLNSGRMDAVIVLR